MKSLIIILVVVHQCFSQQAQINCNFLKTRVVEGSTQYLCMVLRGSIDPNAESFNIVGEHQPGLGDGSVRGILITDSDVPVITKALITAFKKKFALITHFEVFHSRLQRVEAGAFVPFDKLKFMLIAFNNLTNIVDGAFDGLKDLEFLRIINSRVEKISEKAFRDLESVKRFSLEHNNIRELPKNVFISMYNLGSVDISNNELSVIDGDIFYNSNILQYIYLSYNKIVAIGENFFAGMHILNDISINGNLCASGSFKYREAAMRGLQKCFENYAELNG